MVDATVQMPRVRRTLRIVIAGAVLAIASLVVLAFARTHHVDPGRAVVRIVLKKHAGTGFFVRGPDDLAYVVTAHHVVESGEPILVEQTFEGDTPYVIAYPQVEVVAFDADLDLAILRLENVRADRFAALDLARVPAKDEAVLAYGFPESALAKTATMMSKPGKILGLVKFPAYDRVTGSVVRQDAVDGVLVSSDIEPGFSGGPICNERGQVIGVAVTKDTIHRGQNGAVSVTAVRQLMASVVPAKQHAMPTPGDVKALLSRIETEYLMLPIERRAATREQDYVSANDMPRIEDLIDEIRRLGANTIADPTSHLSGPALLGITLMRLPGRPLETYLARSTQEAIQGCELRERNLRQFFGGVAPSADDRSAQARCAALAFRPLVWDMTALALQWEGKPRELSVVKIEPVDAHAYRASVRFADLDHIVEVWLSSDGGRLRLELFDNNGQLAGLTATRTVAASAFAGTWHRREARTPHKVGAGEADVDSDETLVVSVATDGTVSARHTIRRHVYANRGWLPCGRGTRLDLGLEQRFTGSITSGSVVAFRQGEPSAYGADMLRCHQALTYAPDRAIVLKLVGDKLLMHRTDGNAFPETAELER